MSDDNALFAYGKSPKSEEEDEVQRFINELEEKGPLSAAQRVTTRMCLALAKSIAEGNRKGRSVANDVERLMATMQTLTGDDGAATDDDLTPAERKLLDGLATVPNRNANPQAGYDTEEL